MILRALYDYYDRCGDLPRFGTELKPIAFIIVIDRRGNFVRIEDKRSKTEKKGMNFLVSKHVTRSSGVSTNHLWDNGKYVLGIGDKESRCHNAFVADVKATLKEHPDDVAVKALYAFLNCSVPELTLRLSFDPLWDEVVKGAGLNFSFQIDGDLEIIAEKSQLIKADSDAIRGTCLITGLDSQLTRLTSATPVAGAQATSSLVSMNPGFGYDSYGKTQCFNAPMSVDAEFKFSTALNHLLRNGSQNKFLMGNRTFVFWASKSNQAGVEAENSFFNLFAFGKETDDDPNAKVDKVKKVFLAIKSGHLKTDLNDRFYILGLAPNSGRIAVVYWNECPLRAFADNLLKHFDDMEIEDNRPGKKPYQGLYTMLSAVTLGGKASDVQPNLPEAVMKSIMQATPYPMTLYQQCIKRIRAEQGENASVTIARAAILKASINRFNNNNNNNKQLTIMLDKENTNQGYLCGRLFAVLEWIQLIANGGKTNIRARYMNAASATPVAVFATLLNLSVHHLEKLNWPKKFEELEREIMDKISTDGFPAHLDLEDQGRFFVGYYHQRQDLFTKDDKEPQGEQ